MANFGFKPDDSLFSRGQAIKNYCKVNSIPWGQFNIVYLEGCNTDMASLNNDAMDLWNDVRCVLNFEGEVFLNAQSTSEPGRYYVYHPMNPDGAARLALGYHKEAWIIGKHYEQDALVQCADLKVFRDFNKDGFRTGDKVYVGSNFGINQHTTIEAPATIGRWSAGCLVGRYPSTHAKFMQLCRASGLSKFSTVLIDGKDIV
jgi:hypothetical protein